jgi:hypothetical protein
MPQFARTSLKSPSSRATLPSIPEDPADGSNADGGCRNEQDTLSEGCDLITVTITRSVRNAAERCSEAPAWREARDRPADREVRGQLTLMASADHIDAMRAVCSIRHGVLSMRIARSTEVVAAVPVHELAVGLSRECTDMFTVATLHEDRMYDEIYCFADDQIKRNKWIAVFRRMGVPVFDLSRGPQASHPSHSLPPSRHSRGSNDSSSEPTLFTSHFRQSIPPSAELDRPRTSAVRVFATAQRTAHQESNLDAPRDGAREARVKTSARTAEFIHYKLQGQELEAMLRLDLGSSHSPAIPPGPILFRSQTY